MLAISFSIFPKSELNVVANPEAFQNKNAYLFCPELSLHRQLCCLLHSFIQRMFFGFTLKCWGHTTWILQVIKCCGPLHFLFWVLSGISKYSKVIWGKNRFKGRESFCQPDQSDFLPVCPAISEVSWSITLTGAFWLDRPTKETEKHEHIEVQS